MNALNSDQPNGLPMWGGMVAVVSILSVHLIGLAVALLALDPWGQPLDYQNCYRDYEKARQYFTQFEPELERRRDGRQSSDAEIRTEIFALRKKHVDLAYTNLFAGKTLHMLFDELPLVWLVGVSCTGLFVSLLASMLGAYNLEAPVPQFGRRATATRNPG